MSMPKKPRPPLAEPLTEREQHVLTYMKKFLSMNDQLPPCATISEAFGWRSPNASSEVIVKLESKGALSRNELGKLMFTRDNA